VTAAAASGETVGKGLVRLVASVPFGGQPATVARLLEGGAAAWSGEPVGDAPQGMRRFAVDLRLRVGGPESGLVTFRKAAFLDLGPPRSSGDRWMAEIAWRAATAMPLFPVFSGELTASPGSLAISGLYAPPGGVVGRLADRALLHVAANGTARWLLGELERATRELPG
jgi:hypothetical protein